MTVAQGRRFGLTVGGAFLVLAAIVWWRAQGSLASTVDAPDAWRLRHWLAAVLVAAGASLIMAGLVLPARLGPVERAWMGLAHAMSRVTTPIAMGAIYFLVFTPIGALMRALGKNPLGAGPAGWAPRPRTRSDLTRQF